MAKFRSCSPQGRFHGFQKLPVPRKLFLARGVGPGCAKFTLSRAETGVFWIQGDDIRVIFVRRGPAKFQPDLSPASQLDIDLRQQFGVKQRAMQHAVAAVDPIAGAKGIE